VPSFSFLLRFCFFLELELASFFDGGFLADFFATFSLPAEEEEGFFGTAAFGALLTPFDRGLDESDISPNDNEGSCD